MAESVPVTQPVKSLMAWSRGVTLHYLFAQKDAPAADAFFARLVTGADLSDGHPVLTLRNKLSTLRRDKVMGKRRGTLEVFVVKAWNAVRLGRELKLLKWMDDEDGIAII